MKVSCSAPMTLPQLPTAFVIRAITPPYGSVYSGSTNLTSDNLHWGCRKTGSPLCNNSHLLSGSETLSAIFTVAQAAFYYLILCTAAGTGNCNINLLIHTSVWCSNQYIIFFSVYLNISNIPFGNHFFQFPYSIFSHLSLKLLK